MVLREAVLAGKWGLWKTKEPRLEGYTVGQVRGDVQGVMYQLTRESSGLRARTSSGEAIKCLVALPVMKKGKG
jgi:hypothetical protein